MFTKITTNNYFEYVGDTRVEFKYWIDANNNWWYCYEDICEMIELGHKKSRKILDEFLYEEEKCLCEDLNNFNSHGCQSSQVRDFITSEAVHRLIQRNNERNNNIIKAIDNLETKLDSQELYNNELNPKLKKLKNQLNASYCDYEEIFIQIHDLMQTDSAKDILYKANIIDKEKEEIVDECREVIYNYDDIDDIYFDGVVKLNKRNDSYRQRVIRQLSKSKESTCPKWLINIVK